MWELAARRAEVIGRLAAGEVGNQAADAAAAELGLSRRQIYALVRRWRQGPGLVTDLIPGKSSGGRGRERLAEPVEAVIREVLRTRYLTRQKRRWRRCTGRWSASAASAGCRCRRWAV